MFFDKKVFESKYIEPDKRVPVDTLFLIGNGFDRWQGLDTAYASFEKYYKNHLDEVLTRLHLPKRELRDKDGNPILDEKGNIVTYCDVELFYGDPYHPKRLPHEFWYDFETSLDKIDDQEINRFFGRETEGIKGIQRCAGNAQRILREIFCDWITSIDITEETPRYDFGANCLFVNFNYTDTLLRRFGVKAENEFHIHGSAVERDSIIFGHATHPEQPYDKLQMGPEHPRFQGLYYVEEFLHHADKHIEDNYLKLVIFLGLHGVRIEDIKQIYVLGLGFGPADLGYIRHLVHGTKGIRQDPEKYLTEDEKLYLDTLDEGGIMNLNLQYAISHRERVLSKAPIPYREYEAQDAFMHHMLDDPYYHISREEQLRLESALVRRRFLEEQEARNQKMIKEYLRLLRKKTGKGYVSLKEACLEGEEDAALDLSGAQWHISYFCDNDRRRIEEAMKGFGCDTYTLYPSIDDILVFFQRS